VDGCARLEGARRAALPAVKCRVRDMTLEQIQDTVFIANMVRRRFSAGQRVMRYLENHLTQVLETARQNADPALAGARGGRGKKGGFSETPFTSEAIASRIGTSRNDVISGIELLRCKVEGMKVLSAGPDRRLVPVACEEERDAIGNTYDSVVRGETPIRRWAAGAAGKKATSGVGKVDNPSRHARRTAAAMVTMFQNWPTIAWDSAEQMGETEALLFKAIELLPARLHDPVATLIVETWPAHEKKALLAALKGVAK
jgi:hypothetical protein